MKLKSLKISLILIFIILYFSHPGFLPYIIASDDCCKFQINFSERFRFVSWDNTISLKDDIPDEMTFTRHRTSLSFKWLPLEDLEIFCKLTNEFRYYFVPEDREFTLHEIFFDQLYLKWSNFLHLPLTLTIGRQNIMLGEGFLMMDGGPLDGSRSIYFNGLRLDANLAENKVTLFYVYQPVTDKYLPLINEQEQKMIEQPEEAYGVYLTRKFDSFSLEGYYIHKNIIAEGTSSDVSRIDTVGARIILSLCCNNSFTIEAAKQFGQLNNSDRSASGGYAHMDLLTRLHLPLPGKLTLGGIYLSGDDQTTAVYEGWDPLFSRWPKWSESYIYCLIRESKVAYWSNFTSIYTSLNFDLLDNLSLDFTYHAMGAAERYIGEGAFPGSDGTFRGHLFISKLNFKIIDNLTGHFLWEAFIPGDFYFDEADGYNWIRLQLFYEI